MSKPQSAARVAVSGIGSIGRQHIQAAAHLDQIDIIAFDPEHANRTLAAQLPRVIEVTDQFDRLIDSNPTALVIAAPDQFHVPQLIAAAKAGIPTLVEKPLSVSYADAIEAVSVIESTGTPVVMGYVLRHWSVVNAAREQIQSGAIGKVISFQIMLGAYGTIRAAVSRFETVSPNRLYRDYSHEWDYIRWIFGPISAIFAHARVEPDVDHIEDPNVVDTLLRLDSGNIGAVHLDYVDPVGMRQLSVIGTGGNLVVDLGEGTITKRTPGGTGSVTHYPTTANEGLMRQLKHLLDVASDTIEPASGLSDGLAALAVTEAAIRSASTGRWVAVDRSA